MALTEYAAVTTMLSSHYPCHGARRVRLPATEHVPSDVYDRTCPHCGQAWTITRTTWQRQAWGRIDKLEWEHSR